MKYIKTYENKSIIKKYIIVQELSDYLELYEILNIFSTTKKSVEVNIKLIKYYFNDEFKTPKYNISSTKLINFKKILYISDNLEDTENMLHTIYNSKKYNL